MVDKIFDKQFFDEALFANKHEAITPIDNPNTTNEQTGRPVWFQTVLDKNANKNLFFVAGDLPVCEAKYWKFQYSDQQIEGIGNLGQYRIGTIAEMTEKEKEQVDYVTPEPEPYKDWRNLQQTFWANQVFFGKVMTADSTAFALLSKVFTDGILGIATENALQFAITQVRATLPVDFTAEEILFVNETLEQYNFQTRIS